MQFTLVKVLTTDAVSQLINEVALVKTDCLEMTCYACSSPGGLTWCIVQRGLALLDRVLLLRKIHLEFFVFFSRKNTQAMQDPPELIKCSDGWHCQRLFWYTRSLTELITRSWCGCSLEGVWDTWVACSEDCMWSRHVSITFWGVCNHVARPSMVLAS